MTDFIHEAPQPEEKKSAPEETPVTEKERQRRVYAYIAVLFTVAFLLILWSFFSTHRSNQEVIDQLKGSQTMMQSTLDENHELQGEVEALEAQVESLTDQLERTEAALDAAEEISAQQEAVIIALDRLRKIEGSFEAQHYETARDLIRAFEDSGLAQYLPDSPLHTDADGNDAESPLVTYRRIVGKLFPNGID